MTKNKTKIISDNIIEFEGERYIKQNSEEGAEVEIEELLNKIEDVWDIVYDNGTTFFTKKDKSFRCNNWKSFKEKLLSDALNVKEVSA